MITLLQLAKEAGEAVRSLLPDGDAIGRGGHGVVIPTPKPGDVKPGGGEGDDSGSRNVTSVAVVVDEADELSGDSGVRVDGGDDAGNDDTASDIDIIKTEPFVPPMCIDGTDNINEADTNVTNPHEPGGASSAKVEAASATDATENAAAAASMATAPSVPVTVPGSPSTAPVASADDP